MRLILYYLAAQLGALVVGAGLYCGLVPVVGDDPSLRLLAIVAALGAATLAIVSMSDHIIDHGVR